MIPVHKREPAYPPAYKKLRPLGEQAERLKATCSELGLEIDISYVGEIEESISGFDLPERAEGIALGLRPDLLEGRSDVFLGVQLLGQAFGGIDNRFGDDHERKRLFKRAERTEQSIGTLISMQPGGGDVYALPVQLGLRNAKVSDADAISGFAPNEFGLSFLDGASILSTHPERIGKPLDLGLSFPGELYDYDKDGAFGRTIVAKRNQSQLLLMHFSPRLEWMNDHGAATGFVWR